MVDMEVRGCVAALVSAFETGAYLTEVLMEKVGKKKRKKKREADVEESVQRKLLHRALSESMTQCRRYAADKHQQYGEPFAVGDTIAISQLQGVLSSLQTGVIQSLQSACVKEETTIDLTSIYELTIMSRNYVTRTMDELCQRLHSGETLRPYHLRSTSDPGMLQQHSVPGNLDLRDTTTPTSSHLIGNNHSRSLSTTPSLEVPTDHVHVALPAKVSTTQAAALRSPPGPPSYVWNLPSKKRSETPRSHLREVSIQEDDEDGCNQRATSVSDQLSQMSVSDASSRRHASLSISSVAVSELGEFPHLDAQYSLPAYTDVPGKQSEIDLKQIELNEDDEVRALQAPEVLFANEPVTSGTAGIHPAFRTQLAKISLDEISVERLSVDQAYDWSPLPPPSRVNKFHGFCKGAWEIGRDLHQGLTLRTIPQNTGADLMQWACKECEFKSAVRSPAEINALPKQTYYHAKTTIRYRWMFLAKSHIHATKAYKKLDSYPFGCAFCAAEGRATAIYDKVDSLMSHINSKHKSSLMTVETRGRTKCVVGEIVEGRDEWHINVPGSLKTSSAKGGERFFQRYGQSPVPICQ